MKCKIEFELPDILRNSIETAFVHWKFKGFSGQAKATRVLQPEQKFFVDTDGKITPLPKQKHGNWIPIKSPTGVEYGGFKEYTVQEVMCSECGFTDDVSASIYTYCPECGAKMDGKVKQDETD